MLILIFHPLTCFHAGGCSEICDKYLHFGYTALWGICVSQMNPDILCQQCTVGKLEVGHMDIKPAIQYDNVICCYEPCF